MPYSDTRWWTTEDVCRLRKLSQTLPTAEIAAQLGRSLTETVLKAKELKLPIWLCQNIDEQNTPGELGPAGFEWQDLRETSFDLVPNRGPAARVGTIRAEKSRSCASGMPPNSRKKTSKVGGPSTPAPGPFPLTSYPNENPAVHRRPYSRKPDR